MNYSKGNVRVVRLLNVIRVRTNGLFLRALYTTGAVSNLIRMRLIVIHVNSLRVVSYGNGVNGATVLCHRLKNGVMVAGLLRLNYTSLYDGVREQVSKFLYTYVIGLGVDVQHVTRNVCVRTWMCTYYIMHVFQGNGKSNFQGFVISISIYLTCHLYYRSVHDRHLPEQLYSLVSLRVVNVVNGHSRNCTSGIYKGLQDSIYIGYRNSRFAQTYGYHAILLRVINVFRDRQGSMNFYDVGDGSIGDRDSNYFYYRYNSVNGTREVYLVEVTLWHVLKGVREVYVFTLLRLCDIPKVFFLKFLFYQDFYLHFLRVNFFFGGSLILYLYVFKRILYLFYTRCIELVLYRNHCQGRKDYRRKNGGGYSCFLFRSFSTFLLFILLYPSG